MWVSNYLRSSTDVALMKIFHQKGRSEAVGEDAFNGAAVKGGEVCRKEAWPSGSVE